MGIRLGSKYPDFPPPQLGPDLIKILLIGGLIAVGALAWLALATQALGAEVPLEAELHHTIPLPCGGALQLYDSDKNPGNGFEYQVVRAEDGRALAIIEFAPGNEDKFRGAIVMLPGREDQVFHDVPSLAAAYGHPCDMIRAAGVRT